MRGRNLSADSAAGITGEATCRLPSAITAIDDSSGQRVGGRSPQLRSNTAILAGRR